jgi:hypothetical protein
MTQASVSFLAAFTALSARSGRARNGTFFAGAMALEEAIRT